MSITIDPDKFDVYFSDEQQEMLLLVIGITEYQIKHQIVDCLPYAEYARSTHRLNDLSDKEFRLVYKYAKAIRKTYQSRQQKISWIKDVKFTFNLSLKDAKEIVDGINAAYPYYPPTVPTQSEEPPF